VKKLTFWDNGRFLTYRPQKRRGAETPNFFKLILLLRSPWL